MMQSTRQCWWRLAITVGGLLLACDGNREEHAGPAPKPASKAPTTAELAAMSPSKRILGHWILDLAEVPDVALNDDLRDLRKRGLEGKVDVEYAFTESEIILRKDGAGGPVERRWEYEIVDESRDRLELRKITPEGKPERVYATVTAEQLKLGRDKGLITLRRKTRDHSP